MASLATSVGANAVTAVTANTAAATAGSFASAGLAIAGTLIDTFILQPMLAGSVDSQTFTTDVGSVRLGLGDESTPVPRCLGEFNRVQGIPIWSSIPKSRRVSERVGKRGENVEFSWLQSAAFAVSGNNVASVTRVLADGSTVYDTRPAQARTFIVNDDQNGNGVALNFNRFTANELTQYTGAFAFQYSLYHLVLESVPESLEVFDIVQGFGLGEFSGPFTEGGTTRFVLAREHGLSPGDAVPVRMIDVNSRQFGTGGSGTPHMDPGYWTFGTVPDVTDSAVTIDVRANNDSIVTPGPTSDRRRNVLLGSNPQLEMDFRRPKESDLGEHQFLSRYDAGAPVEIRNLTTGDGWDDPGFEVVTSREIGGRRHQLIVNMNDVFGVPQGFQSFGLLASYDSVIIHRATSQGIRSVTNVQRDPIAEPIPLEVSPGDQLQIVQENQTDDDFAESWELDFETVDVEDQVQSEIIGEEVTPFELPAFRGLAVAAARDINTSGSGSRVPNMEFFVTEALSRTLASAVTDIASEWGVEATTNLGTEILQGMTWSGRVEAKFLLEQLAMVFDLVVKEEGYGGIRVDLRTNTQVWDFDDPEINPHGDGVFIRLDEGRRIQFVGDDVGTRPSALSFQYLDIEDDLNRGLVTERLASSPVGQIETALGVSISMTNADARRVARRLLRQFHNWTPVRFQLPHRYTFVRENDYIFITVSEDVPGSSPPETYARRLRILVSRIDEGADGVLRCEGKVTSYDAPATGQEGADPFDSVPEGVGFSSEFSSSVRQAETVSGTVPSGVSARVLSGISLRPEDDGTSGFYVAASPSDPNSDFVALQVFKSIDDGVNWTKLADIPPATLGEVTGSPPVSVATAGASLPSDPHMRPVVHIQGSNVLGTATDLALASGRNRALIESSAGREVVQFKTAVPEGESVWRLETLTRGLLGTTHIDHRPGDLVDGSGVPQAGRSVDFTLIDDAVTFFPFAIDEMGTEHLIRVVPRGASLDKARDYRIDVPAYVAPLTPKDHHYTFVSQDISGTPVNTAGFKEHGEVMSSLSSEIVAPYDMTIEKLTYDIRALAGSADMTFTIKDGTTTVWTSPALGAMVFDFSSNAAVLDVPSVAISAGGKFYIEINSPTTGLASWTIRAGLVANWSS